MFLIRKFEERDVPDCAMCFYESFFDCPLTENDRTFLRDYAQVLAEKCSFTYVAESEGHVVGFIMGHYKNISIKRSPNCTMQSRIIRRGFGAFSSSPSGAIRCPHRSRHSSMSFTRNLKKTAKILRSPATAN